MHHASSAVYHSAGVYRYSSSYCLTWLTTVLGARPGIQVQKVLDRASKAVCEREFMMLMNALPEDVEDTKVPAKMEALRTAQKSLQVATQKAVSARFTSSASTPGAKTVDALFENCQMPVHLTAGKRVAERGTKRRQGWEAFGST